LLVDFWPRLQEFNTHQYHPWCHSLKYTCTYLRLDLQVEALLRAKEEELHKWELELKRELSVSDNDQHQQLQPQPSIPQPQPAQRFAAQPPATHSFPVGLSSQPSAGSYTLLAPPPGHPATVHAAAQPAHHPHIDYGALPSQLQFNLQSSVASQIDKGIKCSHQVHTVPHSC
jgi:hypothetical protein